MQAGSYTSTRRGLLGSAIGLSAAAMLASSAGAFSVHADDAQFQNWARALDDLNDRIESAPLDTDADQSRINRLCDQAAAIEDLILNTPSNRQHAAKVKLQTLIRHLERDHSAASDAVRHVLSFMETLK